MKNSFKIAIIVGIVSIVIIAAAALTVHSRLSESEKSEIQSGAEQKENETPSQVANEIVNSLQNKPNSESGEQNEGSESNENNEQSETTNSTSLIETTNSTSLIEVSAMEVDGVYRWSTSSGMNPVLTLHTNMKNPIHFTNPTDITHAFVIGQNGTTVLSTKDLTPGLSGKISIKPTHIGVFEYHCKYHPDTMKGILNVVP